jgi:FkbM family methyltransferase
MEIKREVFSRLAPLVSDTKTISITSASATYSISSRRDYNTVTSFGNEKGILFELLDKVESDDVFYDIGAHYGLYTCLLGDVLSEGEIIAFEPFPNNVEWLKRNININQTPARVVEKVLWDKEGEVEMGRDQEKTGTRVIDTGDGKISDETTEEQSMRRVTGDSLIQDEEIPEPTVMKIDVEGAEVRVLRGLETTLRNSECRLIFCEIHFPMKEEIRSPEDYDDDPYEVYDHLRDHGFSITQLDPEGNRYGEHFICAER